MGTPAGQTARVGQVSSVDFIAFPDVNGNRVFYFVDATGKQTGHILQDAAGVIHINTGANQELTVDTAGGVTVPNLTVPEGGIKSFQSLVGAPDSGASVGTAGISTTGPLLGTGQINLYGRNITLFNQAANPDGSHSITAQFIYNDVSPVTNGPQTEMWCENACLWLDSGGAAYIRASLGSPTAYGKITTSAASEAGLKTDVEPLTGGLAALQATPPIRFRYNEASGFDTEPVHVGAMYEAVRDAMPEAALFVGGHGQVDHTKAVPYHHAAILELAAENAALRDRMAALEARLPPQAA